MTRADAIFHSPNAASSASKSQLKLDKSVACLNSDPFTSHGASTAQKLATWIEAPRSGEVFAVTSASRLDSPTSNENHDGKTRSASQGLAPTQICLPPVPLEPCICAENYAIAL